MARAEAPHTERLAMARTGPEPRALYSFRDRSAERGPAAFAEPHMRAAELNRAPEQRRTPHEMAPAMASREFRRAETPAPRIAEGPHLPIVQAAPPTAARHPGFGGERPGFGGGHPEGGGHPAPPSPHAGNDRRR